jgi:hypothetical protein
MKQCFLILFSILVFSGCNDGKKSHPDGVGEPEPYFPNWLSDLMHVPKKEGILIHQPWECYTPDMDIIKKFPIDTINLLIKNHKLADSIITDNDIYELVGQTIFPSGERLKPDSEFELLKQETFTSFHIGYGTIIEFCPEFIGREDVLFLYSQITCESYFWNEKKLKNVKCVPTNEFKEYYLAPNNLPKQFVKSYFKFKRKKFKQKYKNRYIEIYSKPIFNKAKTLAIIEHEQNFYGDLLIFKKINNKWKKIAEHNLWIS